MDMQHGRGLSRRRFLCASALSAGASAVAGRPVKARAAATSAAVSSGTRSREYWIACVDRAWDAIPTGVDDWTGRRVGHARFRALSYVAMTPGWKRPLRPGGVGDNRGIPGPVLRAHPGDTLVVHFRNLDTRWRRAHTIHAHGVHTENDDDGTFVGRYSKSRGDRVPYKGSYTYRWRVGDDSVGVWPYHDHGPGDMDGQGRGLFGAIVVTRPDDPRPDREHTIFMHELDPGVTGSDMRLMAMNGRAFAGNTPSLEATVGQDVALNVVAMGSTVHPFHVHGHRFYEVSGMQLGSGTPSASFDSPLVAPGQGLRLRLKEEHPGRWLYHCHLSEHMMMGMVGWYFSAEPAPPGSVYGP